MNKIKLKNGSIIEVIETKNSNRSKRSKLISFYCSGCSDIHINYPIKNMIITNEKYMFCKESLIYVDKNKNNENKRR